MAIKFERIFRSPGIVSIITILLLLSSYIFIILSNYVPSGARFFLFLTLLFLILFLISFVIFMMNISRIADIYEIFQNPTKISVISAVMLLCSYLSSVMEGHASRIYGELVFSTRIFFYLALAFFIFFVICFIAILVSFSNKFIYSKKL